MNKLFIILTILFFVITGCSGKSDSILSTPVQKDAGSLTVLNPSGFLGATVAGTSRDYVLNIKADGGLSISNIQASIITDDPISFKDGDYPGTGGTCSDSLKSGETCTIVLIYEPVDTASHLATVHFNYQDSLKSYHKTYQVSADSHPILSFEYGTLYDFGNKFIGSSTDLRIRISNTGRVTAQSISVNNLGLPFSMKGGSYPGEGGTCGPSLSPGETCDIYINYSPTTNGEHLQSITLNYFNTGRAETNTLRLMAWGFYEAQLTISDSSGYNFGTVAAGTSYDKTFTLTHSGGDVTATSLNVLNLNSPFNYKGGNFPGVGGTCTRTLTKEKKTCSIVITLSTTLSGSWSSNPSFSYFNGKETISLQRPLSAITRQRAQISISPTSFNFGLTPFNSEKGNIFTVTYLSGELPAMNLGLSSLSGYFNYTGGIFPGTGGTCGTSLSSGTCTISLSYRPLAYGTHTLSPRLSYHDGSSNQNISLSLQGRTNSRLLSNTLNFGNVVNGQSKTLELTLTAQGGSAITNLQLASISSPYSFNTGTCGTSISPSASCKLSIVFSPETEGPHDGDLMLSFNDGISNTTHSISLKGNARPAANVTITSTDFGSLSVNSVKEMFVTITNSSTITPTVISWSFPQGFSFKGGSFPGIGGTCWGLSCRIAVLFSPKEAKAYNGTLTLTYNDGAGNTKNSTATLTGIGVPTNDLFISNFDTVTFPTTYVGDSKDTTFTLSHGGGTTPAIIHNKTPVNGTDYSIINDNCPPSLVNGAGCSFTVRFAPQSSGSKASSFSVHYTSDELKSVSRLITGNAINPALLTPSQTALDFGPRSTDQAYDLILTIAHTGNTSASGFTRSLTGSGFTKVSDSCSSTLSVNHACQLTIRFNPTSPVSYNGNLSFNYYNGFKTITTYIPLTGIGAPTARLTFSASIYDFGDIIQTQKSTRTITLSHLGPVPATSLDINNLAEPYSFLGGTYPGDGGTCSDILETGSCTIVVEFAPTSTGVKNQAFTLNYNNGNDNRTINTTLTGEGLAQAIISISEANPFNFGSTNLSGSIDKAFILSNSGSVSGTAIAGSFDLEVFSFKGGNYPGVGGNCGMALTPGLSCSIVLNFKPTEIKNYNGSFTLNYFDGLRTQTEIKNLQGTGTNSLRSEYFLNLLSEAPILKEEKEHQVFISNSKLWANITSEDITLYQSSGKARFHEANHLFPLFEGLSIERLIDDINQDGVQDFLFSIQDSEGRIKGYSIRCGRNFKVLERFMIPKEGPTHRL